MNATISLKEIKEMKRGVSVRDGCCPIRQGTCLRERFHRESGERQTLRVPNNIFPARRPLKQGEDRDIEYRRVLSIC